MAVLHDEVLIEKTNRLAGWRGGEADEERIEMWLRSDRSQQVRVGALDLTVEFEAGEEMLTEVSCKFHPDGVSAELAGSGLRRVRWWTDSAHDFGLSLAIK